TDLLDYLTRLISRQVTNHAMAMASDYRIERLAIDDLRIGLEIGEFRGTKETLRQRTERALAMATSPHDWDAIDCRLICFHELRRARESGKWNKLAAGFAQISPQSAMAVPIFVNVLQAQPRHTSPQELGVTSI